MYFNRCIHFNRLPLIESRKGISPLRSHKTVLEGLPSYGFSCSVTNVVKTTDEPLPNKAHFAFSLFLIAHHKRIFILMQHKVICKFLLSGICGRPVSSILPVSRPSRSLGLRTHDSQSLNCLPSIVQHYLLLRRSYSRHTRFAATRRAGLLPQNLI